jgi:hypothetical protein
MLPKEWLAYIAAKEQEISARPSSAPKKPAGVGKGTGGRRLVSKRQAQAERGKRNSVKAIYEEPNRFNQAQTIDPTKAQFTENLGGNCESAQQFPGRRTR